MVQVRGLSQAVRYEIAELIEIDLGDFGDVSKNIPL